MEHIISRQELNRIRLRGKPKCPHCKLPLMFVYEGAKGYTGVKCKRCRQSYLINTENLEVIPNSEIAS